jgi:hypothetical protein
MKHLLSLGVLFITLILPLPSRSADGTGCNVQNENCAPNLILNSSFEEGDYAQTNTPTEWNKDAWQFSPEIFIWDNTQARTGDKSAKIDVSVINDARWIQTVDVEPNSWYFLSGWIKTENVAHAAPGEVDAGANLMLFGTWERSEAVFESQDWTRSSLLFNSGDEAQVTPGGRLGYWAGATTGTVWFDDLQLRQIVPMDPHPSWKILVLIYQNTDFQVTDGEGIFHHYVASMTQDEMDRAAESATAFVETDIPALASGNMIPEITVRFPDRALTQLSPIGGGWWPSRTDTASDRDPQFDSVIVIWDTRTTDTVSGEDEWIGFGDGLAAHVGTGQTYNTMQIDAAIARGHRNVFKHEWGHSILFHFDAMGITPKPTVGNHAQSKQYVNCETGEFYVWVDENAQNPNIPNSIYNNESGFTHDYYSGTTATAEQPELCLGIPPDAWAMGGPVSHSGNIVDVSPKINDVDIKVKSSNRHNVINPRKRGKIWVAILSNDDPDLPFDPVSQVDIDSIEFGPDSAIAKRYKIRDINDDGLDDLLLRFRLAQTGIACGDSEVTLTGETFDGQQFTGTDSIQTVGCRQRRGHDRYRHAMYSFYNSLYKFYMKHQHNHNYDFYQEYSNKRRDYVRQEQRDDDVSEERNSKRHDYVHRK